MTRIDRILRRLDRMPWWVPIVGIWIFCIVIAVVATVIANPEVLP